MVDNILRDGGCPNKVDNHNLTALGLAVNLHYTSVIKLILKYEHMIDFKSPHTASLLLVAIENLDTELAKLLLNNGLKINLARNHNTGESCLHLLMYKMFHARRIDY